MLYALRNGQQVKAERGLPPSSEVDYTCPYRWCASNDLAFKQGKVRSPHFAHKHKGSCEQYMERDTAAHDAMKECVAAAFYVPAQNIEYGGIEGVRPDLFLPPYVFELQNSYISDVGIDRRNEIYFKHQLWPIWIFRWTTGDTQDNDPYPSSPFGRFYRAGCNRSWDEKKWTLAEEDIGNKFGWLTYLNFTSANTFRLRVIRDRKEWLPQYENSPREIVFNADPEIAAAEFLAFLKDAREIFD